MAAGPEAPTGLSASAAADGTIHFEWTASPGASAYRLEWSADSSFPSGSVRHVDTYALDHVTAWQLGAEAATELYWRVSAFGNAQQASSLGVPSPANLVVTGLDSAPVPFGPGGTVGVPEIIEYPAATVFRWAPVTGAIAYKLEYTNDTLGGGAGIEAVTVNGTQFSPPNPLARVDSNGNKLTWKWRVRAQLYNGTTSSTNNVVHGAWSEPREFQIAWDVAPTNLYPADEITTIHSDISFSWDAVPGAAKYRVTLGTSAQGSGENMAILNAISRIVYTTTYIPTAQASDNTLFWQVTPLDYGNNEGKPSPVHQYRKKWSTQDGPSLPSDPGPTAPTGITGSLAGDPIPQITLQDLELVWEPLPRATFYIVEVRDDFGNLVTCRTASTSATIAAYYRSESSNGGVLKGAGACLWHNDLSKQIQAGRTYNWRVQAVDLTGSSSFNYQSSSLPSDVQLSGYSQTRYFAVTAGGGGVEGAPKATLDLDAFEEDNPVSKAGEPAPLMKWDDFYGVASGIDGYEVILYQNEDRTAKIATFRTPSTRLRINGVLADNTTGNPYYASVRPITPDPSWTSTATLVIGGIDSESAELFVWQKASQPLTGLATQTLTDGSVRLSWNPQSVTGLLDGGSRGYQIRILNGTKTLGTTKKIEYPFFMAQEPKNSNDDQFPSTFTDVPLAPGNNYTFEVAPLDANGEPGRLSRSEVFSVGIVAPTVAGPASVTGGSAALAWASVPGALKYSVQYQRVGDTAWTSLANIAQTSATINGLSQGNYVWQVRTHDASGLGPNVSSWSAPESFTIGNGAVALETPSSQPLLLNDRVLRWSSDVDGATRFQVQIADDAGFSTGIKNYETVATSFAIPDPVVAAKQYYWRVRALAESPTPLRVLATSETRTFTVRTTPAQVKNLKLAVGGSGLTASWTQLTGAATGTTQPITYVVAYREKSTDGDWSGAPEVSTSALATSYTVSGLDSGVIYQFRVAGKNSEGVGPWSDVKELATATAPTAAPTLTITPTMNALALKIGKVSATGGAAITGYRLAYRRSAVANWTTLVLPASATSHTLSNLSSGTSYEVSVAAINGVGDGPATVVSASTLALSSAPQAVKAARGDKQAKVSWSAPAAPGGAITGYVLEYRLGTTGAWKGAGSPKAGTTSAVVTKLTNGKAYQVRIAARTKVGLGAYSAPVTVTPAGKPIAPTKVTAKSKKGKITVTWKKAAPNGSKITGYQVQYSTNGKKWVNLKKVSAKTVKVTTTKGKKGKKVYFRVIAINALGKAKPTKSINVVRK